MTRAFAMLIPLHRRLVQEPRTKRLCDALAPLAGPATSLLDVGSGNGKVGRALASRIGASFRGVDVVVPHDAPTDVTTFDGAHLPFEGRSFDVVLLSDVLHHARDPEVLLAEAVRVARDSVLLKDHFAFGELSNKMLLFLDVVGNRPYGTDVVGRYFGAMDWLAMIERAGATIDRMVWPLDVHGRFLRTFTRSELQFAARLARRRSQNGAAP